VLAHGLEDVRERRRLQPGDNLDYLRTHGIAFDFHVVAYGVEGLEPGVYGYRVAQHELVLQRAGDFRQAMRSVLIGMKAPDTASWTLFMSADFLQYQWRYRHERALRHLYMTSGRLAQRLLVVAQAYRLGTLPTPATRDAETIELLQLDAFRQAPLYTLTMGRLGAS
jgi:SagB-type dehydrogenase family enzyme